MNDAIEVVTRLLSETVLPGLHRVHASQKEQIAANDRLEGAIEELRSRLEMQFAELRAQLTACRAEVAALHATLQAVRAETATPGSSLQVH